LTVDQVPNPGPRVMNPLWIISLFLGVSEVTAGIAATQSTGWVQGLLAIFAAVFPLGVAAAFFVILWRRPFVLYAPGDYSEHTTVTAFVEAMRGPYQPVAAVEEVARSAVEAVLPWIGEDRTAAVKHAMQVVRDDLARRTITVDVGYALGLPKDEAPPVNIPVDDRTTVSTFIRNIARATGNAVSLAGYGRRWVLTLDGTRFTDLGPAWATNRDVEDDDRLLREVGIPLGSSLSINIINRPRVAMHNGQPIRNLDDLSRFSTTGELRDFLSGCLVMELRNIATSIGLVVPSVKSKRHMIDTICHYHETSRTFTRAGNG